MRRSALIVALVVLGGCSAIDRPVMTEMQPMSQGHYRYKAKADAIYPNDNPAAEAKRMEWLARYMSDNRFCPNGYDVTNRNAVFIYAGLAGSVYDIFYDVKCR